MSTQEIKKILLYFLSLFRNYLAIGQTYDTNSRYTMRHKQAVRAFHIDTIHNKPVGLAGGLFLPAQPIFRGFRTNR